MNYIRQLHSYGIINVSLRFSQGLILYKVYWLQYKPYVVKSDRHK